MPSSCKFRNRYSALFLQYFRCLWAASTWSNMCDRLITLVTPNFLTGLHQSSPLLACMVTCFFVENPTFFYFFVEPIFATRPKNARCLCGVARHGVETSNLGNVLEQELCSSKRGLLTVGIDISAPCTHESNSLDVNTAKNASSRKVKKDKVTLCGVLSSCNVQKQTLPSSCNIFAFSGPNQAHNLTHVFHMNVLSNMLLEGYVPGCFNAPHWNSFSKRAA